MAVGERGAFGERLRRLREASGLSQEELAERAGLTANAIGALERGRRSRPYPDTLRRLMDALGLGEEERAGLAALVSRARGGHTTPPAEESLGAVPTALQLPGELTELIGREREAEVVLHLLARSEVHLLTLTGPGGVGKTRLALEVAGKASPEYPDGVYWVPLAPLADPRLVLPTVARSLGLAEAAGRDAGEALRSSLRDKRALLVLDNFEHLLGAARDVAGLLLSCPDVDVLATSRAPLGVRGEQEYPVPPLELPPAVPVRAPRDVEGAASVRLFVRRAREASPSFELGTGNAAAVATVCRRLDGLPLALELAAARVKLLPPPELLHRLDRSLPLLTGGARDLPERQRTMRDAIRWSYDLLAEDERALFRRLSVFTGGWTMDAAEAVGAGGDVPSEQVLDLLGRLVDQSLVVAKPAADDSSRYRMLEPVRQYTAELLEESGEEELVHRRHAQFYLALAERAATEIGGRQQVEWLEKLDTDNDNLRAAMGWSLEAGDVLDAVRFGRALSMFWVMHGGRREGRGWMERALANELPAAVRADALYALSLCEYGFGDPGRLMAISEESAALYKQVGDRHGEALALAMVGYAAILLGDLDRAGGALQGGLETLKELGDTWACAHLLTHLAVVPLRRGDYTQAARYAEDALALTRQTGDRLATYDAHLVLGQAAEGSEEFERASWHFGQGLGLAREAADRANAAHCIRGLAGVAAVVGQPERAALLFGASEGLLETVGTSLYAFIPQGPGQEHAESLARKQLGEEAFAATYDAGRAMTFEQAVECGISPEGQLESQ